VTHPIAISIVVNNFNYAAFLPLALDSVLSQMHQGDELVVVDDGSSDDSRRLLESYKDRPGVRVILQDNAGHVAAVARGLREARSEIVALLDSDDMYLDGYLDRLRAIYSKYPGVSFVSAHADVQGENPEAVKAMRDVLSRMAFPTGEIGPTRLATAGFSEFVGVPTSGISMRLSFARQVEPLISRAGSFNPVPTRFYRLLQLLGLRTSIADFSADGMIVRYASMLGAGKYYDREPGFYYRIHVSNRYATLSPLMRRYQRHVRLRNLLHMMRRDIAFTAPPTVAELRDEFTSRAYPVNGRRRNMLKVRYSWLLCASRGTIREKLRAQLSLMRS